MSPCRLLVWACPVVLALILCSCELIDRKADGPCGGESTTLLRPLSQDSALGGLAAEIDRLEKHVDKYGSVVPQHASVWGQARLMMHRHEFEREMRADVGKFQESIQATISSSDQAYLASALSLSAAASGKPAAAADPSGFTSTVDTVFGRKPTFPSGVTYAAGNGSLRLEPTTLEDQKKRYLDHLHELRRINEGDDNTDAPGYALNLVRLPVSVLPGDCTQTGYGAECTVTATPHLPPELLPHTFRNLVVNDLIGLLTLPTTRIMESNPDGLKQALDEYEAAVVEWLKTHPDTPPPHTTQKLAEIKRNVAEEKKQQIDTLGQPVIDSLTRVYARVATYVAPAIPASRRRVEQSPLPPSQIVSTFGVHTLGWLAWQLRENMKDHLACQERAYHLDVQNALRNEFAAAYALLSAPKACSLWNCCTRELATAVHTQDVNAVIKCQSDFFAHVDAISDPTTQHPTINTVQKDLPVRRTITSILAWYIVVDSALLTERFLQDMRRTHDDKGCACAPADWVPLYAPCPPVEVCQMFNEYVKCRWPIRVFALDPVTDDQNVADAYSLRRETQLALSMAFVGGQISANSFSRYARRIEQDISTIALNRTAVGFSHGDHTFGWRFYPRVQTPPIPGNLTVAVRDLLVGGRGPGHTLRHERLEPGIRECVALVIMPSFIPGVDLDVVGNWFRLAHPKCKELDLKDALRLSQTVRVLQDRAVGACDHDRFRAGDGGVVLAKLDQVSQRLPLQHQQVDVPFENTHGGFELLSSGVTDLGPELLGWYGAPGIDPCGDTVLFLVGDNFSVHQTRVVVGGVMLDPACPAACSGPCMTGSGGCAACASSGGSGGGAASSAPGTVVVPVLPVPQSMPTGKPGDKTAEGGADATDGVQPANFLNRLRPPAAPAPSSTTNNAITVSPTVTASPTASPTVSPTISPTNTLTAAGGGGAATAAGSSSGASGSAAAGPCVYQVELLSRQVMRVVIPKGVQSKKGLVDIHVATPYGVSPALSVPLACEPANCGGGDKKGAAAVTVSPVAVAPPPADYKPAAPAKGITISDGDVMVTYTLDKKTPVLVKVEGKVSLTPEKDATVPPQIKLAAGFPFKEYTVKATTGAIVSARKDKTTLGPAELTDFADGLLRNISRVADVDLTAAAPPAIPLSLTSESVQIVDATDRAASAIKAAGTVRVVFVQFNAPTTVFSVVQDPADDIQVVYTVKDKKPAFKEVKGKFTIIRNAPFAPANPGVEIRFFRDASQKVPDATFTPSKIESKEGRPIEVDVTTGHKHADEFKTSVVDRIMPLLPALEGDVHVPLVFTAGTNPGQIMVVTAPPPVGEVWTVSGTIRVRLVRDPNDKPTSTGQPGK